MFVYFTTPGKDCTQLMIVVGNQSFENIGHHFPSMGKVRKEGTITLQCEIINKITGVTVQWISVKSHTFLMSQAG